jgi:hypothetical protein
MAAIFAGRLAAVSPVSGIETVVYTVPLGRRASFTVSICSRGTSSARFRLALGTGIIPTPASNWIEYETLLSSRGVFERTGLVLFEGQQLVTLADNNNLSVVVYGIEEDVF